jgi:hypothetical protein
MFTFLLVAGLKPPSVAQVTGRLVYEGMEKVCLEAQMVYIKVSLNTL